MIKENEKTGGNPSIARDTIDLKDGIKLAYYDSKESHGLDTALVLLHGYCGSSAYWEKIVDELADSIRVIAPDARGHGLSSAPEDEIYSMELFADDVAALLDSLSIRRAIVLGHSLGGYVTLAFTERYADKLAAFGLVHSTPLPDSEAARANRDKAVAALQENGIAEFVDGLIPKLFAKDRLEGMEPEVARCKEIGYTTALHGAVATAKGMKGRADRSTVIRESALPILLVAGAQDGVIPVESTFSAVNGETRKVELEQAGHMSMMECSAQLAEEIASFVRSI
ncbi:alpha/beta fold hydrolase [Paenibacillus paeoniae]|uniref:Alpha/beta hydrolase n=1 Tax=Paenibacillus paeoniae TaxID=2292705 RepID=A0A371P6D8_9BACL|nr:alpha/beta hydrolase [Paenibacillus paeoniae]REK71462.1 alpha/beta hydrolase [Paenibacillus paeoniae]